jgi:dienelactone hydrolase
VFPGVLMPCGHSANGKAAEAYQRVCILLAQHGMAVLCYDPIGQGERSQLLDKMGKPAIAGSTSEHTMVGIGALLVGQSCATYRIWDGIRSLDYLASRPEVDPKRLGCTGNSGGGTLTSYLMALDDRIVCAAPSCYLTTLERLFATIGPQDAEQNITGQVAFGMEHADYILMRAPRPTLMCVATQDFFDIGGAKTTFKEASQIYKKLGAEEKMAFFEYNDKHGFSKPRREAAVRWLKRWLVGIDEPIKEGDFAVFRDEELQCTRSGQVLEDFKGKSAFQLNLAYAAGSEGVSSATPKNRLPTEQLIGLRSRPKWNGAELDRMKKAIYATKTEQWHGLEAGRSRFVTEPGIEVPVTFIRASNARAKFVLLLHEDGADAAAEDIARLVKAGDSVAAVDLRGWGETAPGKPNPKKPGYFGGDFKESFLGLHLGRPLLGQRVFDLLRMIDFFAPTHEHIGIVAIGATGPVALHAAVLDRRVESLTLERSLVSWMNIVQNPISINQLTNVVPGVLRAYDLPDLAAAVAPRSLHIINPVDGQRRPISQAELEKSYSSCREMFVASGAKDKLVLQAEK